LRAINQAFPLWLNGLHDVARGDLAKISRICKDLRVPRNRCVRLQVSCRATLISARAELICENEQSTGRRKSALADRGVDIADHRVSIAPA
jgi:hypothetical protein